MGILRIGHCIKLVAANDRDFLVLTRRAAARPRAANSSWPGTRTPTQRILRPLEHIVARTRSSFQHRADQLFAALITVGGIPIVDSKIQCPFQNSPGSLRTSSQRFRFSSCDCQVSQATAYGCCSKPSFLSIHWEPFLRLFRIRN